MTNKFTWTGSIYSNPGKPEIFQVLFSQLDKLPLQLQWSNLHFIFFFIPRSKYMKFIYPCIIGLLVRATPNIKMRSHFFLCHRKTKWRTEIPEGFLCPIPPSVRPIFGSRGRVIWGRLSNRFGSWFGNVWTCYNSLPRVKSLSLQERNMQL